MNPIARTMPLRYKTTVSFDGGQHVTAPGPAADCHPSGHPARACRRTSGHPWAHGTHTLLAKLLNLATLPRDVGVGGHVANLGTRLTRRGELRCDPPHLSQLFPGFSSCVLPPAHAQYTTASFGGSVVDSDNAVLPQTQVIVRNVDTGFTQNATTDESGAFLFPRLPVGSYELRVEQPGFSTICTDRHHPYGRPGGQPHGCHAGRSDQ